MTVISWIANSLKTLPSVTSAGYALSMVISIQSALTAAKGISVVPGVSSSWKGTVVKASSALITIPWAR